MNSFTEFWSFYLTQHQNLINRRLHFVGTFLVHLVLVFSISIQSFSLLLLLPIIGYGFAWVGHFFFEKNKPATFKYPVWSLAGDFKMFYLMCSGKLWN